MLSPHSDNSKEITLDYLISGNGIIYVSLNCLSDPTLGGYLGKLLIADLCAVAGKIYTNSTYHNSACCRAACTARDGVTKVKHTRCPGRSCASAGKSAEITVAILT